MRLINVSMFVNFWTGHRPRNGISRTPRTPDASDSAVAGRPPGWNAGTRSIGIAFAYAPPNPGWFVVLRFPMNVGMLTIPGGASKNSFEDCCVAQAETFSAGRRKSCSSAITRPSGKRKNLGRPTEQTSFEDCRLAQVQKFSAGRRNHVVLQLPGRAANGKISAGRPDRLALEIAG